MEGRSLARKVLGAFRRLGLCMLGFVAVLACATTTAVYVSGDGDFSYTPPATLINDVTQMNPTYVDRVVEPTSVGEVVAALRSTTGPVIHWRRPVQPGRPDFLSRTAFISTCASSIAC